MMAFGQFVFDHMLVIAYILLGSAIAACFVSFYILGVVIKDLVDTNKRIKNDRRIQSSPSR